MCGSGQEALPDVQQWSRGHPKCPGVVWRPSQKSGCGRESFPDVWQWSVGPTDVRKWSGVPSGCPEVIGRPSRCPGVVDKPSGMSRSGWEYFRISVSGRLALPDVWEWLLGPPGCPGVVGSSSGCPGVVGSPSGYPGVVVWLSRMSGSGREALSDVLEWSGGPPGR